MIGGFIKWYRKAEGNPVLKDKSFDRLHAFLYLVERANIQDSRIPFGTTYKLIRRGQLFTSLEKLSQIFGWSLKRTRLFIEDLENAKMITTKRYPHFGTIVIINSYEKYQSQGMNQTIEISTFSEGMDKDMNEGMNKGMNEGMNQTIGISTFSGDSGMDEGMNEGMKQGMNKGTSNKNIREGPSGSRLGAPGPGSKNRSAPVGPPRPLPGRGDSG